MMNFKTIEWRGDHIRILDQRRLPLRVHYLVCRNASSVAEAIKRMAIRGAPAIAVAAAMGIALGGKKIKTTQTERFRQEMEKIFQRMAQTRPTAVNLFWAIERMKRVFEESTEDIEKAKVRLEEEALKIYEEDLEINRRIGKVGKGLIHDGSGILTHCNAGALATAGYGTALSLIYAAWMEGKKFHVYVDETRPLLQGARLTAWELSQTNIPLTVITDNMAGWLMSRKRIDMVLVGADRIARNGDTANKIGTYSLAVLANYHHIPFYVVAPSSTIDWRLSRGENIPIEERSEREVSHIGSRRLVPKGVGIFNPAFDVTPHRLIKAIVTEKGILYKPFQENLKKIKDS